GQHEELAPAMRPAGGLGDRSRTTVCFIEPVEARIGIRLENPRVAVQMTLRVIAGPIARIEKHRCRRIPPPHGRSSRTQVHSRPVIVCRWASPGTVVSSPWTRLPAKT